MNFSEMSVQSTLLCESFLAPFVKLFQQMFFQFQFHFWPCGCTFLDHAIFVLIFCPGSTIVDYSRWRTLSAPASRFLHFSFGRFWGQSGQFFRSNGLLRLRGAFIITFQLFFCLKCPIFHDFFQIFPDEFSMSDFVCLRFFQFFVRVIVKSVYFCN